MFTQEVLILLTASTIQTQNNWYLQHTSFIRYTWILIYP